VNINPDENLVVCCADKWLLLNSFSFQLRTVLPPNPCSLYAKSAQFVNQLLNKAREKFCFTRITFTSN